MTDGLNILKVGASQILCNRVKQCEQSENIGKGVGDKTAPFTVILAAIVPHIKVSVDSGRHPVSMRHFAKLSKVVKITDISDQRKSEGETLSAVGIAFGEDTKPFDETDSVFHKDFLF